MQTASAHAVEHTHGNGHHDHAHDHEHDLPFIRKYIFSTDHKVIAKQFLFVSLFFLLVGGLLALLIRWQLGFPGQPVPLIGGLLNSINPGWLTDGAINPSFFSQLFTMHGTIMIFFAIIPLQVGLFGNFCIPLMIGTDDMALPRLNMYSFWTAIPGGMIMMFSFTLQSGAAAAGWTSYPPLADIASTGQTLWLVGAFLVGFSSIMGSVNYITTIINKRAKGMKMFELPTTVWALLITAVIVVLGTPVLASALAMQFWDQTLGSSFFIPANLLVQKKFAGGGQPLLWQHIFWFYSHPAVYIMIVPTMGIVSDILSTFSRKPVYGYKAMVFAIIAIAFLGFIVWGHHMFQSGMNPLLGTTFMLSTIVIAVPSSIKVFNWLGTIWKGNIRFTTPMLNALGFIGTFVIGGLSGVFMASAPIDIYITDTYFIVAHIHYVLFGGSLFGIFAGITYWYPKMFGRMLNENLGRKHFFWTFTFFNLTFFPMHLIGIGGHMRRIYDPNIYDFLKPFQSVNTFISICAFALGATQLLLIFNLLWSIKYGKKAPRNPWKANTLEWAAPSPPPHGNFDFDVHVYRGPYEYSLPGMEQDYLPQWIERTPEIRQAEASGQHSSVSAEFSSGGNGSHH